MCWRRLSRLRLCLAYITRRQLLQIPAVPSLQPASTCYSSDLISMFGFRTFDVVHVVVVVTFLRGSDISPFCSACGGHGNGTVETSPSHANLHKSQGSCVTGRPVSNTQQAAVVTSWGHLSYSYLATQRRAERTTRVGLQYRTGPVPPV